MNTYLRVYFYTIHNSNIKLLQTRFNALCLYQPHNYTYKFTGLSLTLGIEDE